MTRGFIRVLWGEHPSNIDASFEEQQRHFVSQYYNPLIKNYPLFTLQHTENMIIDDLKWMRTKDRLTKVKNNITMSLEEPIKIPFVCYTFGENNHKWLKERGIESVLIHNFPTPYYMYRHKLDALVYGMEDFDEIVYLDWDTRPVKPIDNYFWDALNKKDIMQASLGKYKTTRLEHRAIPRENHWMPSGSFIYLRDKSLPERIIDLFLKEKHHWSEEPGLARMTDELMGNSFSMEEYRKRFDPEVYKVVKNPFPKDPNLEYFYNKCHPWRY